MAFAATVAVTAAAVASTVAATTTPGTAPTTELDSPSTTEAAEDAAGGSATFAVEQEYTTYNNNAGTAVLAANSWVLNPVQPSVFIMGPDLVPILNDELMTSVEVISEDPQTIEWVVNPAAAWEDGDPIDCDDFYLAWISGDNDYAFALDENGEPLTNPDGTEQTLFIPASTAGTEDITDLSCSDDGFTITATFEPAYVDYAGLFANLLPAHVVERETGVADITADLARDEQEAIAEFWNNGWVGFDPALALSGSWYRIDQWNPGETVILTRNENYWGSAGLLDEIVIRLIPSSADQPPALANGEIQVATPQPEVDLVQQLQQVDGAQTTTYSDNVSFEHFDFNLAHPQLSDVRVRQAIALCLDREEIVETIVRPIAPDAEVLNNRIYMDWQAEYVDNSGGFGVQDIEGSRALMEQAGYTEGSDGIYELDGQRASFRLGRRDPNVRRQYVNELAAAQCVEAGIELTDDAAADFNSTRLPASDYDVAQFAWIASGYPSAQAALYITGGGSNWNNFTNPEVDRLFTEANSNPDPVARAAQMNEIDRLMWEDMVTIPLFVHPQVMTTADSLQNVVYNDPLDVTWNAEDWAYTIA